MALRGHHAASDATKSPSTGEVKMMQNSSTAPSLKLKKEGISHLS